MHCGVATRHGCNHRLTARPELGCLPAPALLALLGAEMLYHWGRSHTIQTKGARQPSGTGNLLRGDIAPLQAEIRQLKA